MTMIAARSYGSSSRSCSHRPGRHTPRSGRKPTLAEQLETSGTQLTADDYLMAAYIRETFAELRWRDPGDIVPFTLTKQERYRWRETTNAKRRAKARSYEYCEGQTVERWIRNLHISARGRADLYAAMLSLLDSEARWYEHYLATYGAEKPRLVVVATSHP